MERWRELKRIKLKLPCGGIATALKGRPGVLRELTASVDVRHPHVDFDRLGTFDGAMAAPSGSLAVCAGPTKTSSIPPAMP